MRTFRTYGLVVEPINFMCLCLREWDQGSVQRILSSRPCPGPATYNSGMSFSPISALSPLDGRYASKLSPLRPLMSELGYMHRRVQVEVAWFIALSDAGFDEFKPLTPGARTYLLGLVKNFSEADGLAIKEIEKTTNHDVKAVEYWIKSKFEARPELQAASEFVHFACTIEDINNTSHALQIKAARDVVILPALDGIITKLRDMAHAYADVPLLSRTHRQTDHGGQGSGQRAGAPGRGPREDRCGEADGQDEWCRGQLQRPPLGLARL